MIYQNLFTLKAYLKDKNKCEIIREKPYHAPLEKQIRNSKRELD